MKPSLSWAAALRIALRELRVARTRFLFVVLAVALGVGALTGVRGFSRAFRTMLLSQARTLMAADMTLRVFGLPNPTQLAELDKLQARGVARTLVTETITMATSADNPNPLLVAIKAVDPSAYPYYGEVTLNPPQPLRQALTPDTVVVSEDLLLRLKLHIGDMLHLGGQDFRIVGTVASEPDRMTGTLNVGSRVMITQQGLDRTGLIKIGSRAAERFLFRLSPAGPQVEEVRRILKADFPDSTIADYRETHPTITQGLNRATTFLSLIGLIALVIGSMGMASAMHSHLELKLDSIAVMKCLGARSSQIIKIYGTQTLLLGLAGGVLGALFGIAVAASFPSLIAKYFTIEISASWDPIPALQGIVVACLVTLLFTIPPLMSIRDIRPAQVFRHDVASGARPWSAGALAVRGLILAGTGVVAGTLTDSGFRDAVRTGTVFAIALAVGVGLLAAAAWVFLRGLRAFQRGSGARLPQTLRQGIGNLYRPGSQTQSAVVALGVGVMFTLMVWLIQGALVTQLRGSAPPGAPNVFLLDIPADQRQAVTDLVAAQRGVRGELGVASTVAARITSIDGVPVEQLDLRGLDRRFLRTRSVTEMAAKPPDTEVLSGAWWPAAPGAPQVCANEDSAKALHLHPGSSIVWDISQRTVTTRVACIERTESVRMAARFEFLFNPGPLANTPAVLYGTARVRPADVAALQRVLYQKYPTITVVNVADVLQIVEDVVDRIATVIRFISVFTILAGVVMVASSVAGTRFRRMREVVILKTLGATRGRIASIFSVEFFFLGAVAGIMGSLLASAFARVALRRLLNVDYGFDWKANLTAVALAALVAVGAGWVASFRVLGRKPLEILREE